MADPFSPPYDTVRLRRLSRTILALSTFVAARATAAPVATLVTVGPGDAVWEKFGHNMIRLQDDAQGFDVCYNWGLFDFDKPHFIFNFVQGRMVYTMAALRTGPQLDEYKAQNRRVTFQRLNLSPAELNELIVRCEKNRLPENADYPYDYFRDNCSTRVRDMLDGVTRQALSRATEGQPTSPGVTYRSEAMRLMQDDFWISLGADFALGPLCDRKLDRWQEEFLPDAVARDSGFFTGPLTEPWTSTRPPPLATPPTRWPWLMLGGIGGAAAMGFARGRWRAALLAAWWLISGLGGAFMAYVWGFTDHLAGHANANLWCYSPIALVALLLLTIRRRKAVHVAAAVVMLSAWVGAAWWAIPTIAYGRATQFNGGFILLALPLNFAAVWVTRTALTKPPAVDEVPA